MRLARTLSFLMIPLVPVTAGAVDVNTGAEVDLVFDSNVFRTSDNQKEDGSFRFTPSLGIVSNDTPVGVDIMYRPTYEAFFTYTDANDFSHDLQTTLDYEASEQTELTLSNRFRILMTSSSTCKPVRSRSKVR